MASEEKNKNFGIVITCYQGNIHITKGLLASIRYFCNDVPVCLIVDGTFSIKPLLNAYNITNVIRRKDVKDDFLRNNCFGTRMAKMIAFWESPFDYFLYLDGDIVFWGNPLELIDFNVGIDFWFNQPHEEYSEYIIKTQYFDYDKIFRYIDSFKWEGCHFFNCGAYITKKRIFDLNEFKELFQIYIKDKKLIFEDQGMINFLLFKNHKKGNLKIKETPLQAIVPVIPNDILASSFQIRNNKPRVNDPVLIHWAGIKLNYRQDNVFKLPMNYFRKLNLKYTKSFWKFVPGIYFRIEELKGIYQIYYKNQHIKLLKRIIYGKIR